MAAGAAAGAAATVKAADAVALTVALFCTRSFDGPRLGAMLTAAGVDLARLARVDVSAGRLVCADAAGAVLLEAPVGDFRAAAPRGCDECADFTGRLANISVGNLRSPDGLTTVLVRTEAGEHAWALAAPRLEWTSALDLDAVRRTERVARRAAVRAMRRDFDPDGALWMDYSEHVDAYAESDCAQRVPPGHRSHHYRTAC